MYVETHFKVVTYTCIPPLWHVGVLEHLLAKLRAIILLNLMLSGIVNGYQLLCCTHTVTEKQRELQLYFYFTHFLPYSTFSFCVCHSDIALSFLGCLNILCLSNKGSRVCLIISR